MYGHGPESRHSWNRWSKVIREGLLPVYAATVSFGILHLASTDLGRIREEVEDRISGLVRDCPGILRKIFQT